MVKGNIKIVGLKNVQAKLDRVAKACPKEASKAINQSLMAVHGEVKDNLSNKILNVDTGTLRRSFLIANSSARKLMGKVGTKIVYAAIHEFGGKAGRGLSVRLRARYYFKKSIKQSIKKINGYFDKAVRKIVKA